MARSGTGCRARQHTLIASQVGHADQSFRKVALSDDTAQIERGRYLVKITGCSDCHTPGYAATGGVVPEQEWLTGDGLGWRGPWGTTYAINLRLYVQNMSEQEWVAATKSLRARPPMPWFALRDMSNDDRRALYRFIRHLGTAGNGAPGYLPPDQVPNGPHVAFPQ